MEQNGGKPVSGKITFTLKLKGHKTPNGEYAVDVEPGINESLPQIPMIKTQVYLDKEAVAHTQATQVNLPIMGIRPTAIEGGKVENAEQPEKGKKRGSL
jgi:hypothetical protein